MNTITKKLISEVNQALETKPKEWRKGQFVFNYLDQKYSGVATTVQFMDKVDCFYDDSKINIFIEKCAKWLTENELNQ